MKKQIKKEQPAPLEERVYPVEFLSAMKDTAFQTIQDFLKKIDAPKEASGLLEDLATLSIWTDNVEMGNQVANQILLETVASASRNIVELGGVFYSPSGTTVGRKS